MIATPDAAGGGSRSTTSTGDGGRLPREAARNTAGVAALALLTELGERRGVALTIRKGLPLSSGLGGSAASAAAAVVAVDALLGAHASLETLIACALEGERLGAGSAHADNIAPSICGGFVLVRRAESARHRPAAGARRADGCRRASGSRNRDRARRGRCSATRCRWPTPMQQWANLGAFVDGLHRGDFALIARSLEDTIAEPRRAPLVPGLAAIKRAAVEAGALGCSLSGSGPSLFALCRGEAIAAARRRQR